MPTNYAEIAAGASLAVEEAGAPVVLTQVTKGEYDASTSEVSEDSLKSFRGFAVQGSYRISEIDGAMILAGDTRLLIAVTGMPRPMPDNTISFAGDTFRVVNTTPIQPGAVPVLWDVQARK